MSVGRTSKYVVSTTNVNQPIWQCGIYLRLSREDGDKLESDSIINQRKIIDRYLEKNPDLAIYDTYIDDGFSGTNFERPEMTRLLSDIKSRKVNCLIVKDLSRFGRNYHETGRYLEVVFPLLKLRFISITDNIDSYKNPQSLKNSTVSFKNVMNDEYARDISSKIRSSFNAKRKRGEYIGSFALYGYMKDPEDHHKLVIDDEAAENVRLIFQMFLNGISIYNITQKLKELGIKNPTEYRASKGLKSTHKLNYDAELNGWSTQTIRRMLKNQMYIGNMVQGIYQTISHKVRKCVAVPKENYIIKEGTHDAIIDKETFARVQERFQHDTWQSTKVSDPKNDLDTGAIYVGYIKCADCGRAMQRSGYMDNGNSLYYFICGSYLQWKQCSRHATRVKKLNDIVLKKIQKHIAAGLELNEFLNLIKSRPIENPNLTRLKNNIAACEAEKDKELKFQNELYLDYKNGLLSKEQYKHFMQDSTEKIVTLDLQLKALSEDLSHLSSDKISENIFIETCKKYKNITTLSRELIVELIDTIYIHHNGGIRFKFKYQFAFESAVEMIKANIDSSLIKELDTDYLTKEYAL